MHCADLPERLDSADWKKEERMMVMVMRMRRPILAGRKLITTVKKNRIRVESIVLNIESYCFK